jgi:hypothetical protein
MLEEKLIEKLEEISKCLIEKNDLSGSQGALAGEPGIALFLFYYSKFSQNDTFSDKGLEILEKSVEIINSGYNLTSFCSGISGTAWVFDHLESKNLLDIDNDEFLSDLEVYLFEDMIKDIKFGNYDFLHNSLGIAYYFLIRYYNTKSIALKNRYIGYLEKFIDELHLVSELDENSIRWKTKFDHKDGEIVYNLNLAHGISSIIIFLTKLSEIEKFSLHVNDILYKAVNFILKYYRDIDDSISFFPSIIKENEKLNFNTRLAWCNGDLGIGLSLWKASIVLKDIKLEELSIKILKHASKRRDKNNTMVNDAGLCHGSFGNAQIFMYLFKQTRILDFQESTKFWLEDGLKQLHHDNTYAGHMKLTINGWKDELSLLEGLAGIGLSIMAYLNPEFSLWDECLMIN